VKLIFFVMLKLKNRVSR